MTATRLHLPKPREVAQLLADTLGRDADTSAGSRFSVSDAMSGFYMNEAGDEGIICMADVPLVNFAGAALALIPANIAEDGAKRHKLSDAVIENYFEVLNIMGALLNQVCEDHVRLVDVKYPGDELPGPVAEMILKCENRHDLRLDIEDYGTGNMSLLLVP
ncbi:MAG TPA: hypothetical protein PLQ13_02390 [Candidatus Krumholzibacteria bacterium]|nr:hypothetical protein [Candidatus Krumholzibacteria bacterium]